MTSLVSIAAVAVAATLAPCAAACAADLAPSAYRPHYRGPLPAPVVVRGPRYDYRPYRVVIVDHSHDATCEDPYDLAASCRFQGSF